MAQWSCDLEFNPQYHKKERERKKSLLLGPDIELIAKFSIAIGLVVYWGK